MDQLMKLTQSIKLQARVGEMMRHESNQDALTIYQHAIMSLAKDSSAIIEGGYWKELPHREGDK